MPIYKHWMFTNNTHLKPKAKPTVAIRNTATALWFLSTTQALKSTVQCLCTYTHIQFLFRSNLETVIDAQCSFIHQGMYTCGLWINMEEAVNWMDQKIYKAFVTWWKWCLQWHKIWDACWETCILTHINVLMGTPILVWAHTQCTQDTEKTKPMAAVQNTANILDSKARREILLG